MFQKKNMMTFLIYSILISLVCFSRINEVDAVTINDGIEIYQKNARLSLNKQKKLAEDINRYHQADNLWDELRRDFQLEHYEQYTAVQEKINWYVHNQESLSKAASRAAPYLYYILQQVKKRHLPAELVLLPIIESGYDPLVYSNAGAAGLWQMMPKTASSLGIKQNKWYDGRRDILASTGAALNYFVYLRNLFNGNWLLALAAYNTGEGNVLAAIKRNIRHGRNISFWSLPVAQQTRDYVPNLLALATIISHPKEYPIHLPLVRNAPYLAQVTVDKKLSLKLAAHLAGIRYNKIVQLNPGFKKSLLTTQRLDHLVLPIANVAQFTNHMNKTNTSSVLIKSFSKPHKTPTITTYAIKVSDQHNENHMILSNFFKKLLGHYVVQPSDIVYVTRAHDSLQKIAEQFHTSIAMLSITNQLHQDHIQPGRKLIIPTEINSNITDFT